MVLYGRCSCANGAQETEDSEKNSQGEGSSIKYVKQEGDSDCFPSALASYFGIEKSSIPDFSIGTEGDSLWMSEMATWTRSRLGKGFTLVAISDDCTFMFKGSHFIVSIDSNCATGRHAVLVKDGKIVFDPLVGEVSIELEKRHKALYYLFFDLVS